MEDGAGGHRSLITAAPALLERSRCEEVTSPTRAARAEEPLRPGSLAQMDPTAGFVRQLRLKLPKRARESYSVGLLKRPECSRSVSNAVTVGVSRVGK